ncbi:DNA primase [Catenisphaera adipataccumulans]|uniref:DNA primase n=1 Tax=Catenisphaera adipataccumulans TaxID=700500 RepID=A0A7W8CX20_9FIRM|nr:DNA primase [Catenisphaera adipataccumulans]MBB5183195.1 DNA primase [Catenisphaera adipataccumulans]
MSWIAEEDLKAIRSQADIVDIISHYLDLEKRGKDYKAVCPFHDDHDPSLSISAEKQIFKCFVCGAGGDVFGFVQRIENISFQEAVYKVADMIHYPLEHRSVIKREDPNQRYYDALQEYIRFTCYELKSEEGKQADAYLRRRKMTDQIIDDFEIGYAPAADISRRFLQAKQYSPQILEEIGLTSGGRILFHDRFLIPIHDENGYPVGFTARRLNDRSSEPKYINTSATKIYEKGNFVFNYHRARPAARKAERVILTEGAMDVLAFEKAGIHEAIACLGTACTQRQLQLIAGLKQPVTVCYDGDQAGQDAAYKFGRSAAARHLSFQIVQSSTDQDPDEIFDSGGKEALSEYVSRTISWVDFLFDYLRKKYNLDTYEDRKAYAQEIFEAIKLTDEPFEKQTDLQKLKQRSGFDFSQAISQPVQPHRKNRPLPQTVISMPEDGRTHAERVILSMMLLNKDAARRFKEEIGFFKNEYCRQIALYCYDIYREKDQLDPDDLMSRINEEPVRRYLNDLLLDTNRPQTFDETYFEDSLTKVRKCLIQEQLDVINRKISSTSDLDEKLKLWNKKKELIMNKDRLGRKEG